MLIETALRTFLTNTTAVSALVGGRIYPEAASGRAIYPRITYELASETPDNSLAGDTGQPTAQFVFRCWGHDDENGYGEARALAAAVGAATGNVVGGSALKSFGPAWMPDEDADDKLWVQSVRVEQRRGGQAEEQAGGLVKLAHLIELEITVAYKEG